MKWNRPRLLKILSVIIIISSGSFKQLRAQTPSLDWAKALGGTGNDEGRSVATDLAGNVFTTGRFNGTADFDPGAGTFNLTSAGNDDIFISKLDATGNFVWAVGFGSTSYDQGRSIAIDPFGNILVTGEFRNTIDFDPGAGIFNLTAPSGLYDIYVLKLDGNGNFVWAVSFGDPASNSDIGYAIDTDVTGNVYVTGIYSGTADFDPGVGTFPLTALGPAGFPEVFILKLSAAGNFVWAKSIGGTAQDHAYGISIDPLGNVIVGGDFIGTVDFDPGASIANLTPIGFLDPFILKLDGDGNFVWAKSIGGGASEQIWAVTTDTNGNIFATGDFQGSIDLDPGVGTFIQLDAGTGPGSGDIFILKLDVNGNFIWGAGFGDNQIDRVRGAAVDGLGNSYFTGYFRGTVDFDPAVGVFNLSSTPSTASDIFISKYDPSGNLIWAGSMGGTSDFEIGNSITVSAGNIYVTGGFFNTADFDPGSGTFNLISNGSFVDAFVVKLAPTIPAIPTIISFTPTSGAVGNIVTITGTNFSTTPTDNLAMFNGATAMVTASTTTSITVIVLAGATTGKITVTVGGNTATSASNFTVTTNPNNQPPVIAPSTSAAPINGIITIDLLRLISDPDDNVDLSTLSLTSNISEQGAAASITSAFELVLNYGGVAFAGTDRVLLSVCDLLGECDQQELSIEVRSDVIVYNAVSPNNDGLNDIFYIRYINLLPETRENKVSIYNRWGDLIFETTNYDNDVNVFKGINKNGNDVTSGTYFYKIEFKSGREKITGFLSVKQ